MSAIRFLFILSVMASNVHYSPLTSAILPRTVMRMETSDPCVGKDPTIKIAYNFDAAGWYHCVFIPAVDANMSTVDFSLKKAESVCNKFRAGLLQLRNSVIHANVVEMAKKYPASEETKWYHPLGVEQLERHYPGKDYIPAIKNQTVNVTWDSGQSTLIDTEAIHGNLRATWSKADREGVTYMSRALGKFTTEEPGRTKETVRLLCHQWEGEFHPKFNVCNGNVPEITTMAQFFTSGKAHCVFRPPDEKEALNEKSRDLGYWFELDDLRKSCRNYYGKPLQVSNAEIYHAIINVTQKMDTPKNWYPLGIKKKHIVSGEKVSQAGINITVTWKYYGPTTLVIDGLVFGTTPWNDLRGPFSFFELPSGHVYTQEPSALQGPLIAMCHTEEPINPPKSTDPPPVSGHVDWNVYTSSGSNIATTDAKNCFVLVILILGMAGN